MKIALFLSINFFLFNLSFASSIVGVPGQHGNHGQHGSHGYHGTSVIIDADSTYQEFNLNGGDATDGSNGDNGSSAYSCTYSNPNHDLPEFDLYGASGGDAGDGGIGGDGGDGGDAVIYYKNQEDLKNIKILQLGGQGGKSGKGGYWGGAGCSCDIEEWTITSCERNEENEKVCSAITYHCYGGAKGSAGHTPADGKNGNYGKLQLIKDITALPYENSSIRVTLDELSNNIFNLSKIIWKKKNDAKELFHPASNIQNTYTEYEKLSEKKFELQWDAKRSIQPFLKSFAHLTFDGTKAKIDFHGNIFHRGHYDYTDTLVDRYHVTEAYLEEELDKLTLEEPIGEKENFSVKILDHIGLSKIVSNKVHVELHLDRFILGEKLLFSDYVSKEYLKIEPDGITIYLGKLPNIDAKKLKATRKIHLEVNLERSIDEQSVSKRFMLEDFKIPKI